MLRMTTMLLGAGALDPYPTSLARRDGGDFGSAQGARKELCEHIVTDEGRGAGPKSARPFGVVLGSPPDCVASLVRDHQPGLRDAPCREASKDNHGAQSWSDTGLTLAACAEGEDTTVPIPAETSSGAVAAVNEPAPVASEKAMPITTAAPETPPAPKLTSSTAKAAPPAKATPEPSPKSEPSPPAKEECLPEHREMGHC